jgi:hypothetical protein
MIILQVDKIKLEPKKDDNTTGTIEIQRNVREYFENTCTKNWKNVEEMNKVLTYVTYQN